MKTRHLHIEWIFFSIGLFLLAIMDTKTNAHSLCFFEWVGFEFCFGEGLGHSIAYLFQGDFNSSLQANFMGPATVFVLSFRILSIWKKLLTNLKKKKLGTTYV